MAISQRKRQELIDFRKYRAALETVTVQCGLQPLNKYVLTSCVGYDEEAMVTYLSRRDGLQQQQEKLQAWQKVRNRSEEQHAVCKSLIASYEFYVNILNSLIKHSKLFVIEEKAVQPELFDVRKLREGGIRYVRH
jgi:hypothetical protein